jgi:sortase A
MSRHGTAPSPATKGGRGRWRFPTLATIVAVIALIGVSVVSYPSVAQWFHQRDQSRVITDSMHTSGESDQTQAEQLRLAHRYNDAVSSGAELEADHRLPTGAGKQTAIPADVPDYEKILDDGSTDAVMSRLRIKKIDLDLPVYHGTSDETLLKGLGHLEGTSLPVGGEGTHSVLTGHRGLADAEMFTHLDKVTVGDTFSLSTFGQVMTYKVVSTKVVDPEDTASLRAQAGKDLVTLVTCTPLGINSQRILVTAERVHPTAASDLDAAKKAPEIPGFPWWTLWLGACLAAAIGYVVWSGFPQKRTALKKASRS